MTTFITGPYRLKRGTTQPPYRATLVDGKRKPIDLTGVSSVRFVMRKRGTNEAKVDAEASFDDADLTTGKVRYDWGGSDTDTAGVYDAEWVLLYVDGGEDRVPNDGYSEIIIEDNLS